MKLNQVTRLKSKKNGRRVGRGIGSGKGKTSGSGHKGQKSRSGVAIHGFEGGQMPLQRRLPKRGFASRKLQYTFEVRLSDLSKVEEEIVDLDALKNANIVPRSAQSIKVIATGEVNKAITIQSLLVSVKAKEAIENAGGKVID